MRNEKKMISIVVPVCNEQGNIHPLYDRVVAVFEQLKNYQWELVFTNNNSSDDTLAEINELHQKDPEHIRAYSFSKNVGYQKSNLTGMLFANGDAIVQLDADCQDPPEMIATFIQEWEQGAMVVYGIRKSRLSDNTLIGWLRKPYYRLLAYLSEDPIPKDVGDFRLVDRSIVDVLEESPDQQPFLRGAIANMGFKQVGINYQREARVCGQTKFSFFAALQLALDGIFNHSIVPLRLATFLGLLLFPITIILILVYLVLKLFYDVDFVDGYVSLIMINLFSISIISLFFGVLGEYIGRMYKQIKPKPISCVQSSIGKPPVRQTNIVFNPFHK